MAKAPVVVAAAPKARLVVRSATSATIYRPGFPFIDDNPEAAVVWLAANGFTLADIVVEGTKPTNWDAVFPAQS